MEILLSAENPIDNVLGETIEQKLEQNEKIIQIYSESLPHLNSNNSNSNNNNNNSNGIGFKMAFGQPVSAPAPQINNRSNQNSFSSSSVRTKEPCCKALYDFEAENSEELDFKEGILIKLIARLDDNWLLGELNGRQGRFPISYVEVINPLP